MMVVNQADNLKSLAAVQKRMSDDLAKLRQAYEFQTQMQIHWNSVLRNKVYMYVSQLYF